MSSCPTDTSLLATSYNCIGETDAVPRVTLWRLPPQGGNTMFQQCNIEGHEGIVKSLLWNIKDPKSLVMIDSGKIHHVSLDSLSAPVTKTTIPIGPSYKITTGQWCPLLPNLVVVTHETSIRGFDLRSRDSTFVIERAHSDGYIRALDFNPNALYSFATGGDDCKVKFWDTRKPKALKEMTGHSHWVWNVKYNPFHDDMLVSSGSDCKVILWSVASLSFRMSNALKERKEGEDVYRPPPDSAIKVYDDHEDSVYGLAWSACTNSSWNFASLSYDGHLLVNTVPQEFSDPMKRHS
ncbi:EARP-interacting protein [Pelomyxa schiedti]|nr:EARP-interacting protein [Pelomyxa schiedti]